MPHCTTRTFFTSGNGFHLMTGVADVTASTFFGAAFGSAVPQPAVATAAAPDASLMNSLRFMVVPFFERIQWF